MQLLQLIFHVYTLFKRGLNAARLKLSPKSQATGFVILELLDRFLRLKLLARLDLRILKLALLASLGLRFSNNAHCVLLGCHVDESYASPDHNGKKSETLKGKPKNFFLQHHLWDVPTLYQ